MPFTSELRLKFKRRLVTLQPGECVSLKLSAVTQAEASALTRNFAYARKWRVSIERIDDGIKVTRLADGQDLRWRRGRWGLADLEIGDTKDFELPPSDWPLLRNAACAYGQRSSKRFSVQRQGDTNILRVRREPLEKQPRGITMALAGRELDRQVGQWPFSELGVGEWFFVPAAEKASASQISPLCIYHGRKLSRQFSVRSAGRHAPEDERGSYVIRVE